VLGSRICKTLPIYLLYTLMASRVVTEASSDLYRMILIVLFHIFNFIMCVEIGSYCNVLINVFA
jgi:hypothetical protein